MPATASPPNALPQVASIKIEGQNVSLALFEALVEARVSQAMNIASRCELHFADPDFKWNDLGSFDIGYEIEIFFGDFQGRLTKVFKGEVTSIGVEQGRTSRHELVIEAYDKSHRLGHTSRVRTFLQMTYADMIRKIAGEVSLSVQVSGLPPTTFDYTLQNSTDFAFFEQIAWRTGTEWFVEDNDKLIFRERPSAAAVAELKFGVNLSKFRARFSGTEHVTKSTVRGWDPKSKKEIVSVDTAGATNPANSSAPEMVVSARSRSARFGRPAFATGAALVETAAEADAVSKALGTRQATAELIVKGEAFGLPSLKAGAKVKVAGVGTKLAGEYYLTEVEHVFGRQGDLVTRFTAGGLQPSNIVDLIGRSGNDIGPWGREGLVVGIVTNNKDPDGLSRVKVKFPTLSDNEESNWARLVMPGAGGGRGWQVIPEINDEVVVGFEHGDMRRPYVLGGVWNGKDKPPVANADFVNSKVEAWSIKTRGGLVLALLDGQSPDKKALSLLLSDKKTKLLVDEDKIQIVNDQKPIELNNGKASIVLKANGDIMIKGANITIEGTGSIKLDGKSGIEAKSGATMKLEAAATLEAKGSASAKVESSGILELKGSMVKIN